MTNEIKISNKHAFDTLEEHAFVKVMDAIEEDERNKELDLMGVICDDLKGIVSRHINVGAKTSVVIGALFMSFIEFSAKVGLPMIDLKILFKNGLIEYEGMKDLRKIGGEPKDE